MVGAAQFSDDFSDGNFTSNPIWAGDNANFEVDANGFLHLNAPAVADESFLSVASVAIDTASWEFSVRLEFNPSSSNRARVYLVSSDSNLKGPLNGYYVLIGNTEDEISLYSQSGTTVTKIIDGVDDLVDTDPVEVKVLVTRSTNGDWELFADTSSSANYQLLGQVTDTTFQSSTFFGVWCDYTSTRSDKFYFDDFHVSGNAYLDVNPPLLLSAQALSNNQVLVTFNEAMDQTTAQNTANYNVNNAIGAPTSANLNGATQVILSFTNTFSLGSTYTLSASSVEDLSGNALVSTNSDFQYVEFSPATYRDVVINEIMADPSPVVGLPELEFIEIYNASANYINLDSAQIGDPSTTSTILGIEVLGPGEYAILCHQNNSAQFSGFGRVIGLSTFPTLNNAGDQLSLFVGGLLVDDLNYTDTWYDDVNKKSGGFSLEQINPNHPCNGKANWKASLSASGGTPGVQNSVLDFTPDLSSPEVTSTQVNSTTDLTLRFSKLMDSLSIANGVFSADNGLTVSSVSIASSLVDEIIIVFTTPLDSSIVYNLSISSGLTDCLGNILSTESVAFGLGVAPQPFDLVINELYPDPDESSTIPLAEFVELFNRSEKLIRLEGVTLNDRSTSSTLYNTTIPPGEFIIVCDDGNAALFEDYGRVVNVSSMPSLNNSADHISIKRGKVILDEVDYDDSWYGDAFYAAGGYTLERINPENLCGLGDNWRACLAENLGTPGSVNSIFSNASFSPVPSLVSGQFSTLKTAELFFDRRMDSASLSSARVTWGQETFGVRIIEGDFTKVAIDRQQEFERGKSYSFLIDSVSDCTGSILMNARIEVYLHDSGDIVINELLTNPRGSGTDFVELYNHSAYAVSLKDWSLAYKDTKDSLRFNPISTHALSLSPAGYVALNEDNEDLVFNYPGALNQRLVEMNLPSYANDKASVLLYDQLGTLMDRFEYSEDLQFDLIDNLDGVSIERLDPKRATNDPGNWHSASSTENYGTPGYMNSQSLSSAGVSGFSLSSDYVSPDNDGYQDNVNIDFVLSQLETVIEVKIYTDNGLMIRTLASNLVVGNAGSLTWDGTKDNGEKARTGIHIIVIETFDLNGNRSVYRMPVVVASRL